MTEDPRKTVRVRITGRVQGVWFRAWTCGKATELGLAGWVRNRADGSVEALFSGDTGRIGEMLRACHDGPPAARVDRVETTPAPPPADSAFVQLPTA